MTMKMGRILALAKKEWKRMIRDPAVLFMIILFPLVLTIAFGASFGAVGGSQSTTYSIGVVDLGNGGNNSISHQFVRDLASTNVLKSKYYQSNQSAQSALSQGQIQGVLILPSSFDASVNSFRSNPNDSSKWINSTAQLYLDRASVLSSQIVPSIIQQTFLNDVLNERSSTPASPIQISNPFLVQVTTTTVFDSFAPGLFAFASIYLIMMVAASFVGEREDGILYRVIATPTTSSDIMLGSALSYVVIGFVQVILVFASAYAFGYHPIANASGLAMGFLIATIFALCNVGFGLITASIAKSTGAATGISFLFLLPQLFLGTFVGSALSPGAQSVGRFVPAYYVTDALTSLFTRGASVSSSTVLTDLLVVAASSVAILTLGILLFRRESRI
jgi:ABC-2 type transport system permease protein